jgi:hypothetical protein
VCRLLKAALVADSELVAAFRAAGSQHLTAIGRLHALTEAMYTLTAAAVRLVGTFHMLSNFKKRPPQRTGIVFIKRSAKIRSFGGL